MILLWYKNMFIYRLRQACRGLSEQLDNALVRHVIREPRLPSQGGSAGTLWARVAGWAKM